MPPDKVSNIITLDGIQYDDQQPHSLQELMQNSEHVRKLINEDLSHVVEKTLAIFILDRLDAAYNFIAQLYAKNEENEMLANKRKEKLEQLAQIVNKQQLRVGAFILSMGLTPDGEAFSIRDIRKAFEKWETMQEEIERLALRVEHFENDIREGRLIIKTETHQLEDSEPPQMLPFGTDTPA